MCDINLAL